MKSFYLICSFLMIGLTLNGQSTISDLTIDENERHANAFLSLPNVGQRLQQSINFEFTAIALKSKTINNFSNFAIITENDTLYFTNDAHGPNGSEFNYSALIHYNAEVSDLNLLYPPDFEGIDLVLINGQDNSSNESLRKKQPAGINSNCELPNIVPQSDWRSGLNPPSYSRSFTTTRNMIVHHSAGSNNATNYRQVVREIYILHTQENGWSDIGYNYLIAPDGVLYAGRDPAEGQQDQVLGAHFCGSNSGTMGVCLMGNYDLQDATEASYETLQQLLTWKGFKDELNVQSQNSHPLNSELGVIAGHRDGCSTKCPGDYVYARLAEIRTEVADAISSCTTGGEEPPVVELPVEGEDSLQRFSIYPNPIGENFELNVVLDKEDRKSLNNLYVFDAYGRNVKWERLLYQTDQLTIFLPKNLKAGMYFLYVVRANSSFHRKFLLP